MKRRFASRLPAFCLAVFLAALGAAADGRFHGLDGEPLPFADDGEVLEFLRAAKVVSWMEVETGTNETLKVLLEKDGVRANAAFRSVSLRKDQVELGGKTVLGFEDSYRFEVAAYELSRMLGLRSIPPALLRRIDFSRGSVQLWIEDVMSEGERNKAGVKAPDLEAWSRQQQAMRLFDRLIFNFDRNSGNILIDGRWKIWMIDHTRSFRLSDDVDGIQSVTKCEREVWEKLRALDAAEVKRRLKPYLNGRQIRALLKRRDKIVAHLEALMAEIGEETVLYESVTTSD